MPPLYALQVYGRAQRHASITALNLVSLSLSPAPLPPLSPASLSPGPQRGGATCLHVREASRDVETGGKPFEETTDYKLGGLVTCCLLDVFIR